MALIARMVRRMDILNALDQLHFLKKRAGKPLGQALFQAAHLARERGWDLKDTVIYSIETQRKSIRKSVKFHAKGRFGIMNHRECRAVIKISKRRAPTDTCFTDLRKRIRVNRKGVKAAIRY